MPLLVIAILCMPMLAAISLIIYYAMMPFHALLFSYASRY